MPVEGQRWTSDPFTLTERDGKLYGRGACDMKGFLACVLASVPLFKSRKLKEPIHIIISYDEEVGCTGVRPLIARLGADLPRPRAVIVGEPTSMKVIDAHKRIDSYRTRVTGREAHSSMPEIGVNAIAAAAALIGELERLGADIAARQNDPRFEPPYSTVMVGTIKGGTAPNIVPKHCEFQWQVRSLPSAAPAEVPRDLAAFAKTALLPRMRQVTQGGRHRHRDARLGPGLRGAASIRGGRARARAHRRATHPRRVLHHRGRAVRAGRLPVGDLRARQYRPGPRGR